MASEHEKFWEHSSFAFVGHSAKKPFPKISYTTLKKQGGKAFPIDPSAEEIAGDKTFPDFDALPEPVEAAVLEVPKEETADWVRKAAGAGIKNIWIHMDRDTPEALDVAEKEGLKVLTGTCAVMYVKKGFSFHSIHRFIRKMKGKY